MIFARDPSGKCEVASMVAAFVNFPRSLLLATHVVRGGILLEPGATLVRAADPTPIRMAGVCASPSGPT